MRTRFAGELADLSLERILQAEDDRGVRSDRHTMEVDSRPRLEGAVGCSHRESQMSPKLTRGAVQR